MTTNVVTLGELMMRLSPPGKLRLRQAHQFDLCHGGAEANVASALAQFGLDVKFVTALPESELGTQAIRALRADGVDTTFVSRIDGRMGLYFLEAGSDYRSGCVIYDRANTAFTSLVSADIDWDAVFEGTDWFHISGITPAISQSTRALAEAAVAEAHVRGVHISVDLNYRERLWTYGAPPVEVMPGIVAKADTLIAGRGDCPACLGLDGDGENGSNEWAVSLAKKLGEQFSNLSNIAITIRSSTTADQHEWRAYLKHGAETKFSRTYALQNVVDRVGTGDAFSAGLIYGLVLGKGADYAVSFGAAANSLKHSIVGDANSVTVSEIETLMETTSFGRLRR